MDDVCMPLMATKLNMPLVHPATLQRHQLLDGVPTPDIRLVLLSAPAGFGKTTLLASWCQRLAANPTQAIAWLTLDERDNEPQRFLSYLVLALAHAFPDTPEWIHIAALCAGGAAFDAVLGRMINTLQAATCSCLLVLDDYQRISAPAAHGAIAFLLDHLPTHVTLVIASRADPPLPLARLRARRQLLELRSADLCFNHDETHTVLQSTLGSRLPRQQANDIQAFTEGWPAGVQLVALALCPHPALPAPAEAGAPWMRYLPASEPYTPGQPYIFAYLADEVFGRLPPEVQTFLLYSSLPDYVSAALGAALLHADQAAVNGEQQGQSAAADMLATLNHANLFIAPLDAEYHWYRYHPLFHSFLRERLAHDHPDALPTLHRRASAWFAAHGMLAQAVEHALQAPALAEALAFIERLAIPMIERGEYATLHRWLDQIPQATLAEKPAISLWAAWSALFAGEVERIEPALEQALRGWATNSEDAHSGAVFHLRAHLARLRGDAPATIDHARAALAILPPAAATLRAGSTLALGAGLLLAGQLNAAEPVLAEALAVCQDDNFLGMLAAYHALGDAAKARAALREAATQYQQVLQHGGDRPLWEHWQAMICLGDLAREWNDLAGAQEQLRVALTTAEAAGVAVYFVPGYVALARTLAARGDYPAALRVFQRALALARRLGAPVLERTIGAYKARLALAQHDAAGVQTWRESYCELPTDPLPLQLLEQLTLVRVLIAAYRSTHNSADARSAHQLLAVAETNARAAGQIEHGIEINILKAQLAHACGEPGQATIALEQALKQADTGGYTRMVLDEGAALLPMLELLADPGRGVAASARRLLATLRHELDPHTAVRNNAVPHDDLATPYLVEALSEREIAVLERVAHGASNQDIANALVISLGTVKSHLNHILGKLAARNRTEAVARAREFGLIPTF